MPRLYVGDEAIEIGEIPRVSARFHKDRFHRSSLSRRLFLEADPVSGAFGLPNLQNSPPSLPPGAILLEDGEYRTSPGAPRHRKAKRDAEFYRERPAAIERLIAETDALART
jgi:hypothetical protein